MGSRYDFCHEASPLGSSYTKGLLVCGAFMVYFGDHEDYWYGQESVPFASLGCVCNVDRYYIRETWEYTGTLTPEQEEEVGFAGSQEMAVPKSDAEIALIPVLEYRSDTIKANGTGSTSKFALPSAMISTGTTAIGSWTVSFNLWGVSFQTSYSGGPAYSARMDPSTAERWVGYGNESLWTWEFVSKGDGRLYVNGDPIQQAVAWGGGRWYMFGYARLLEI